MKTNIHATQWLMDHDARVGERRPHALGSRAQQQGAHAGRHANAPRCHGALDQLHRVVDGQARRH